MKSTIKLSVYRNEEITLTGETQELKDFIVYLANVFYEASNYHFEHQREGSAKTYSHIAQGLHNDIKKLNRKLKVRDE